MWTVEASLVILHPEQHSVLLLPVENQWALPHFTLSWMSSNLHLLQRAVREQFNAEMTVLRWMETIENAGAKTVFGVWLMENHTPEWTPTIGSRWFTAVEIETFPLKDERERTALLKTFESLQQPDPPERSAWMKPAWFGEARQWVIDTLTAHGYTLTSPPEQFKLFPISYLMRVETDRGLVYFKATADLPLFCHESRMMERLAKLLPEYIPTPIAVDEKKRWMLMDDFGEVLARSNPTPETLENLVKSFAGLQQKTTSMIDTLLDAGCLDRRLPVLSDQIDGLLADELFSAALDENQRTKWLNSGKHLKTLCKQLAAYNIPDTLVHGDFHSGNITRNFLVFDWTDACITHPFFDLPVFLQFGTEEGQRDQLRSAYLDSWTDYEPIERLEEAYAIAEILASLHQVISYQGIRDGTEHSLRNEWNAVGLEFIQFILNRL